MRNRSVPSTRVAWDERWRAREASDFDWYLSEPPPEVVELLQRHGAPEGAALDIGCGDGVATVHLARSHHPAVGIDIAAVAIEAGVARARSSGSAATFLVAEAPSIPFRDSSFSLILDRGCLHNIPRSEWPAYFVEVERLLGPTGTLQIYVVAASGLRPLLSRAGMRERLGLVKRFVRTGRWRHRRGGQLLLKLRSLLPPSLEVEAMRQVPFVSKSGRLRTYLYLLARKRAASA